MWDHNPTLTHFLTESDIFLSLWPYMLKAADILNKEDEVLQISESNSQAIHSVSV